MIVSARWKTRATVVAVISLVISQDFRVIPTEALVSHTSYSSVKLVVGKNVRVSAERNACIEATVATHPVDANLLAIASSE